MNPREIEQKLIQWSAVNSGYDEHRPYVGLSGIADCSLIVYRRFFNHTGVSTESRLKTRYSYEIERNIKERLMTLDLYSPGKEISVYDGLVKGHTDGEIDKDLLEIATVPLTEHIPTNNEIPRKKFWQAQAYMLYGNYDRTVMIYFARDYGVFRVFEIRRHPVMGDRIMSKVDALVEFVRAETPPPCDCGRCQKLEEKKIDLPIGKRHFSSMPERREDGNMHKEEWLTRYKERMIERGLSEKEAQAATDAVSTDEYCGEDDPEGAADDELSYWTSDE